MVNIKNKVRSDQIESLIQIIYEICKTRPNLSPRSKEELFWAYSKNHLLIAIDNSTPVGWLLRIPLTEDVQELAAGYVMKPYRLQGIFKRLLQNALEYTSTSIVVTFNASLADYLVNNLGFKTSSFWEAVKISKGKFLLNRLNFDRLKAIKKHYQAGKPKYLVFNKNE